jgi:hypothetical protein
VPSRAQRRGCGSQIEPKSIAGILKELELEVHPGGADDEKIDDAKCPPTAMATCFRKVRANRALAITFHTVADITWDPSGDHEAEQKAGPPAAASASPRSTTPN